VAMKVYTLSLGAALDCAHNHPERTARRSAGDGVTFQVWTNRKAMAKSIRMQERRAPRNDDWKPLQPLADGEGF
jgi:hypothetical protein